MTDFKPGRDKDSDETEDHVAPKNIDASVDAPEGVWVDVPKGMVIAPGTEVDKDGVLRLETGELAIWHHRCKFHPLCDRVRDKEKFVKLEEVVYLIPEGVDESGERKGAPWCPDCITKMAEDDQRKQLQEIFRTKTGEN